MPWGGKITILFQVNATIWFQLLIPKVLLSCFCLSFPRPLGFPHTLWLGDPPDTGQGGTGFFCCKMYIQSLRTAPAKVLCSLPCPQVLSLLNTPFPPVISFHISFSIRKPFALACFFIFSFTCLLQDKLQHWFYHKIMLIGSINHNDYIKVSVLHPPGLQKVLSS